MPDAMLYKTEAGGVALAGMVAGEPPTWNLQDVPALSELLADSRIEEPLRW